jgi:hypothetical protein
MKLVQTIAQAYLLILIGCIVAASWQDYDYYGYCISGVLMTIILVGLNKRIKLEILEYAASFLIMFSGLTHLYLLDI